MPVMATDLHQQRQDILEQMQGLEQMRRGCFSRQVFQRKGPGSGAGQGPYFLLQRYEHGRKVCERVPAAHAAEVAQQVKNYQRFRQLAEQFVEVTDALTRQSEQGSKKNSRPRRSKPSS